jgi:hypothetical protein
MERLKRPQGTTREKSIYIRSWIVRQVQANVGRGEIVSELVRTGWTSKEEEASNFIDAALSAHIDEFEAQRRPTFQSIRDLPRLVTYGFFWLVLGLMASSRRVIRLLQEIAHV